jgi:type VI secretion system protein ImpL
VQGLLARVVSRWLLSLVGTALLAVLVWFFGPFLAFLEGWGTRLAIVLAMLAAWAGINLLLDLRRRGHDAALAKGVTEVTPDPATVASSEEAAAVQQKLATALALLRKARSTRNYLYEEPWYAIIGPPGAGKTTALLNSGLRFPLAAEMGQGPVAGVGRGADRYRRPLHHPGFRCLGRSRRVAGLSRSLETHAAPPTVERDLGRDPSDGTRRLD